MRDRTAIDTIKGYFYQFDYSIDRIISLNNENDTVVIEGIEDIDIKTATDELAIQCKYYANSEYNHSKIAEPIRQMLNHFAEVKRGARARIHYKLRGHYKCGQHKLSLPLSVKTLKENFLTYKRGNVNHEHHIELGLSDTSLKEFISLLEIDINAKDFDKQLQELIASFAKIFNCSGFAAEFFYYNNSLRVIRELAIKPKVIDRTISKKQFLQRINTSKILFHEWFIKIKGEEQYFKRLRAEYFTALNVSPFERFFLLEVDRGTYSRNELKQLLFLISKKWSRLSVRDQNPFCPYVYIHGIDANELIELKRELMAEDFLCWDGFDFEGATFNPKTITRRPHQHTQVKIKIINSLPFIDLTLAQIAATKEIYQFYLQNTYYECGNRAINHVRIQVKKLSNIKHII
jgi:hypothetical protein